MRHGRAVERGSDFVVLQDMQIVLHGSQRTDGCQALLRVATVHFQVLGHHGNEEFIGVLPQGSPRQQDVFQLGLLVQQPLLHRRDQLLAVDEVHLQRRMPTSKLRSCWGSVMMGWDPHSAVLGQSELDPRLTFAAG